MSGLVHKMGLYKEYFNSIRNGMKRVEVRLNDEKRRKINIGDIIEFVDGNNPAEKLRVKVTRLRKYKNFKDMYSDIPLADFDCKDWSMKEVIDGTYEIYTKEQENEWGTLAINIENHEE